MKLLSETAGFQWSLRDLVIKGAVLFLFCIVAGCAILPGKPKETPQPEVAQSHSVDRAAANPQETPEAEMAERKKLRWQDVVFFWWPKPKAGPPVAAPLETSGVISFVNLPANFVILETSSSSTLPVGLELSAIKDGRITSKVKVSAERRPPFVIAEIIEGIPERGDRFYPVVLE